MKRRNDGKGEEEDVAGHEEKNGTRHVTVCHLERGVHRATVMIKRLINFRLATMKPVHANDHNGVSAAITTRSITLINRIQLIYICMTSSVRCSAPFIPYSPRFVHADRPFQTTFHLSASICTHVSRIEFFHRVPIAINREDYRSSKGILHAFTASCCRTISSPFCLLREPSYVHVLVERIATFQIAGIVIYVSWIVNFSGASNIGDLDFLILVS